MDLLVLLLGVGDNEVYYWNTKYDIYEFGIIFMRYLSSSRPIIKTSVNIFIVRITFLGWSCSYYQRSLLTLLTSLGMIVMQWVVGDVCCISLPMPHILFYIVLRMILILIQYRRFQLLILMVTEISCSSCPSKRIGMITAPIRFSSYLKMIGRFSIRVIVIINAN